MPRLKEIRIERGVSQVELARRMGVSQSYVAKIEARTDASVALVRRYIEALGGELGASWCAGDQSRPIDLDELVGRHKLRDLAG